MRSSRAATTVQILILGVLVESGCEQTLGPVDPPTEGMVVEGPWRGDVEVLENTCSGDTQNDSGTWYVTQQMAAISIFFSHQEFVGMIERDGRFETRYRELKRFEPLRMAATISGRLMPDGRLVATQTIDRTSPIPVCRIVKLYVMERFPT